jgi:predicted nucleic acid-binding Zn ribbon protein
MGKLTVEQKVREHDRGQKAAREGRPRSWSEPWAFGRKPKLTRHQIAEAIMRREAGEALVEIGRSYNVSHSTISRLATSL